jgi:hypothetical protein
VFGVSFFGPKALPQGIGVTWGPHGLERKTMAEIKSTLELALERTRRISISQEEKEEIKRKETLQKATGIFHRYMEDTLSLNELLREIERIEEKARPMVRDALLSLWIDAVSLEAENEKLLRGIESLKGRSVDEIRRKLEVLRSEYERRGLEAEQKMEIQLAEALRKEGIHGTAVVPRVKESREWKEKISSLAQGFQGKIEECKEALRKL